MATVTAVGGAEGLILVLRHRAAREHSTLLEDAATMLETLRTERDEARRQLSVELDGRIDREVREHR